MSYSTKKNVIVSIMQMQGANKVNCFIILLLCSLCSITVHAQRENVWAFGTNAGLDFNSGSPMPVQTAANDYESSASVCDTNGQLIFYTDGNIIWNRNGQVMLNGNNIIGTSAYPQPTNSTTQGALIVPMPDSASKYYLFSLTSSSGGALNPGYLYYSVIDMGLDGGLGAIEVGKKGILLDSMLTESLTGVEGDQCNIWVIVRSRMGLQFNAYSITAAGIDTSTVVSGVYINTAANVDTIIYQGGVVVSPDRKKIAAAFDDFSGTHGGFKLELDDFDPATGIVSNRILLDSGDYYYKCSFSPGNSKLYVTGSLVFQYDLSSANPATIIASQTYVGPDGASDIKLAPDGKVYFNSGATDLGAIEMPDLAGAACLYTDAVVALATGSSTALAFPNVVPVINSLQVSSDSSRLVCFADSTILNIADSNMSDILWDNGSTGIQHTVYATGIYIATYHTPPCTTHIDTFIVDFINALAGIEADTIVCSQPPLLLQAPIKDAVYLWQDGSTGSTYNATASGTYTVQISKSGCMITDSLGVNFINLQQNLGNDTIFCKEDKVQWLLNANVPPGGIALWSNGSTDSSITINDSGTYWVTVSDAACMGSDTVHIGEQVCNCIVAMPNAFTPNGDGKDDIMRPIIAPGCVATYILRIYNRWGALINSTTNESQGWDGTVNGTLADIGTYMYTLEYQAGLSRKRQYLKGDITLIR